MYSSVHIQQQPEEFWFSLERALGDCVQRLKSAHQDVRVHSLLERRCKRLDQFHRKTFNEAYSVCEQCTPALEQVYASGSGVKRRKETVFTAHVRCTERSEKRRLASVGVSDERNGAEIGAGSRSALPAAAAADLVQLFHDLGAL